MRLNSGLFRMLPERYRSLGYIILSMLILGATVFIPTHTFLVPPNDFLLVAWDPGRQLLDRGFVDLTYPYPLWTPVLMLPLVLWSPAIGAELWLICNLLMLAISITTIIRLMEWPYDFSTVAIASLLVGVYDPIFTSLWLGQLVFVSLIALVLLVRALQSSRWVGVGLLLAVSLIKPQVTILVILAVLGLAAWQRRWAVFATFAAVVGLLVALAAPFAVVPRQIVGGGVGEHLTTYLAHTSTLWGLMLTLIPNFLVLPALVSCVLLVWIIYLWIHALYTGQSAKRIIYLIVITTVVNLLIVPYSWSYNQAILVFPFAYAIDRAWRLHGFARIGWFVALFALIYPATQLIYRILTVPHQSDVYQIIPVVLFLPLIVILQRSVDSSSEDSVSST